MGLELIDPAEMLGVVRTDTSSIIAFPRAADSVRTSALSRNLLGSYVDREFGLVRAGIVTQLRLPVSGVGAGQDNSGLVADSMVLAFVFDPQGYGYGNLDPQVFRVFELQDPLSLDSVYFSNRLPNVFPEDLVRDKGARIRPDPFSFAIVGSDSLLPQLRIPLELSFAQRLLDAWGTPDLASNAAFQEFLKGFWIVPDNGAQQPFQAGLLHLVPLEPRSKATIYYRNTLTGDTLAFDLAMDPNTQRYTTAEHDFSQAQSGELPLLLEDSTRADAVTHVQGLGGVRTELRFPHLEAYVEAGLTAVARAELLVPLAGTHYPFNPPPQLINIFRRSSTGELQVLPDQLAGIGAIGGEYDRTQRGYRFNITRYVQGIINGTVQENELVLVTSAGGVLADRAVLAGPGHPETPMVLEITFTTY